ncbi:ribonuclease [Streptomyces sp. NBC_00237]|uniref:ribonuclease domain-containing protein n=1 Tax=Streptomyces sp. NBC_00237 TaxID=2975687 RepID=UPI0022503A8B|nr:ribonuclease domain-containing protein [Streptomyces sp. NBC_00237]MCX5201878.1 ribonuclease [Streptomyces sp. NBC_00237]
MRIPPRTRIAALAGAFALTSALLAGGTATASAPSGAVASTAVQINAVGDICYSKLPTQAHDTLGLIEKGGPYPYEQDGTVFKNREGVLPGQTNGYYHEYTVITPGAPTRGAKRVVTGEKSQEDYYTADHYASFDLVKYGC